LTCKAILTNFLEEHYALLGILIGAVLVSISLGPYSNFDSETEFAAASSVVNLGAPYSTPGNLINQPPIGFYIDAVFLKIFGLSYATGVGITMLFGVGCILLVYKLGKIFYGVKTGLLAAGILALTPWHIILSRSFLIDTQCLFFSLLYLIVGIWAIRKASLKLFLISGTLFGIALMEKLFAVFMLIPLLLIYLSSIPKKLERSLKEMFLFITPSILFYYLWYGVISQLGVFSIFSHDDFSRFSPADIAPSPFFIVSYFAGNPGVLFFLAAGISVVVTVWKRKHFTKIFFSDMVCLVTISGVASVNLYLVLVQSLWVPYVDPVKYEYQLLPAFCLLVASLAPKAYSVAYSTYSEIKRRKLILAVAIVGLALLAGSILLNIGRLQALTRTDYLLFRVEGDISYSFVRLTPTIAHEYLAALQGLGILIVAISLLWKNGNVQLYDKKKTEF
jgi:4-amino-4-deoxy-L-arabinose transferase-like glycosyltransferase